MNRFWILVQRELWEHPAIVWGPIFASGALLGVLLWVLVFDGLGQGMPMADILASIEASAMTAVPVLLSTPMAFAVAVSLLVGFHYFADCLFAERRDRSIQFYKSLPVTDVETIAAKFATGAVALPVITIAALIVYQLVSMIIVSVLLLFGGGELGNLWRPGALISTWIFAIYAWMAMVVWYAPFIGWVMLASAWAGRSTLLWIFSPLLLVWIELLVTDRSRLGRLIMGHLGGFYPAAFGTSNVSPTAPSLLELIEPLGLITTPALWIGVIVAVAFLTGAVFLRRLNDDG